MEISIRYSLWFRVIAGKYGMNQNHWDSGAASRSIFRCPWKSVKSVAEGFFQQNKWKVGSGELIKFWEDIWCGEMPLFMRFPSLYRLSQLHNQPIVAFVSRSASQGNEYCSWDFKLSRNLTDRESREASEIIAILEGVHLNEFLQDRRVGFRPKRKLFSLVLFLVVDSRTSRLTF